MSKKINLILNFKRIIIGVPLKNDLGDNNCFLNVLIHTLYNITPFYDYLMKEKFNNEQTFFIELKKLFVKYDRKFKLKSYPNEEPLDPYEFRRELANLYRREGKFRLKRMEDPIEALLAINNAIHSYSIGLNSLKECDKPCNPQCIAHKLFWINIYEQEVITIDISHILT